jgi:hypothetical protein
VKGCGITFFWMLSWADLKATRQQASLPGTQLDTECVSQKCMFLILKLLDSVLWSLPGNLARIKGVMKLFSHGDHEVFLPCKAKGNVPLLH